MIEAVGLCKRYGDKLAVDDVSFTVRPGMVTGFLGPNGAGKSTTMRLLLDLDEPTAGTARVNGKRYREHTAPMFEVGALLEARAIHTGRTARNHLLALAVTNGVSRRRVDEVLGLVGLDAVADKRVGGFSLGMGQRLGIATALLGDPATLLLDEPVNGLDPEGVLWVRNLLKRLAGEGRTVFVSSHLMSEMALMAEHLVVLGQGRLIADTSVAELTQRVSANAVRVDSEDNVRLRDLLVAAGAVVVRTDDEKLRVTGLTNAAVGRLAADARLALVELVSEQASLEEAFMEVTRNSLDFVAVTP
jgi:ABC-2 type transport system ATP-binding protein